MRYKIGMMIVLLGVGMIVRAQHVEPTGGEIVIGKPMPDVTLNVEYVNAGVTSLKKLRGKPLVLVFFGKGCSSSFINLPKLNTWNAELKDKVQLIMVGIDEADNIRQAYEIYQQRFNLKLPVAYDKMLYKRWSIHGLPTSIWINKEGVIQAVTSLPTHEQLTAFVEGIAFDFTDTSEKAKRIPFDSQKPFMINGNGAPDSAFMQRSLLAAWKKGMAFSVPLASENPGSIFREVDNAVQLMGVTLADLYRTAYFGRAIGWTGLDTGAYGKYHYSLILETKDTSRFAFNYERSDNLFCYSLHRPPSGQPLEMIMQNDLKNYFGYEATIEVRKFPYLALVANHGAATKLKANPSRKRGRVNMITGGDFFNLNMDFIIMCIAHANHLVLKDLPLVNETGIHGSVDIKLDAVMANFEDVKRALEKNGLKVVKGEREMKVIVIRDSNNL